jgi:hypothetical protein
MIFSDILVSVHKNLHGKIGLSVPRKITFKAKPMSVFSVFCVRDVEPNQDDLSTRVTKLAKYKHADMVIDLLALYLPQNSIGQLSHKVISSRNGGVV